MTKLREYILGRTEEMVALLQGLVERESPSSSKDANDALAGFVGEQLEGLGLAVERHRREEAGDHLVARWGSPVVDPSRDGRPNLVLCHMDTVWPLGTLRERPFRRTPRALHGPGVFDMKGGLACAIFALRALRALGLEPRRPLTLVCNSDEEVGSPTSRALIEGEARRSEHCLVMESGEGFRGNLKTRRKGIGAFRVRITGQAAHASLAPARGASAIEELAHLVLRLRSLADPEAGTTINVGVVEGGIARNVVAPWAEAQVDVRTGTLREAQRVADAIASLAPVLEGTALEASGGMNRPPMEPTAEAMALFHRVQAIAARELDMELGDGVTGGGSDGQFASAVGCPTLDGLGVIGGGAHSAREFTLTRSLPERATLLATLLLRL
jgi:glutamate carboxypeptidase